MTASAEDVAATVAEIIRALTSGVTFGEGEPVAKGGTWGRESIDSAYRWLLTVEPPRGNGAATVCRNCGGAGGTYSPGTNDTIRWVRCELCTPGLVTDQTGNAVMRNTRSGSAASKADDVYKHLNRALAEVLGAVSALQSGFGVHDTKVRNELPHERAMPRTATAGEVKAARAARARRLERGESWGEG